MKLLDLFCGAGGAAMGYSRAGFDEIVGIDIEPQKNYPFTFIQGDALHPPVNLEAFDLIHASPPCQAYSEQTADKSRHPELVEPTRLLLAGYSHIIENVRMAGLAGHVMLCGSMFNLQVQRHRYFELSEDWPFSLTQACNHKAWRDNGRPWTVTGDASGHNQGSQGGRLRHKWKDLAHGQELMEMPWAQTEHEVREAIPPAYTEYLGRQFLAQVAA